MKILNDILQEEKERLLELEKIYKSKIQQLPKGSLIKKNIKGHNYYYLNYRSYKKQVFKYIGKLSEKEVNDLVSRIKERRKYEKFLRQVKKDIKEIEKKIK
ncbi:MAG: hypothetical protein PHD84_10250 [Atribacterota bacterium]|jgi:hypothetical protein|nr:hypothetical protein [Atribacterota bacterium]